MPNATTPTVGMLCEAFHETARAQTRLDDFGDASYLEGLSLFLESALLDSPEVEILRSSYGSHAIGALIGRLVTEAAWKRHRGWEKAEITRPIIIAGLPRTATTTLHQLLALDPQHQAPEQWLLHAPQPRPERHTWESNPFFKACDRYARRMYAADPQLEVIHPTGAGLPEEDWPLLEQSFASNVFEILGVTLHRYSDWLSQANLRHAMERHQNILKLIGLGSERRWVLKSTTHLFVLDDLLQVYPDALIIQTHRDPRTAIPSACSLIGRTKRILGDSFDQEAFGRHQLAIWSRGMRSFAAARRTVDPERIYDLAVADLGRDTLGAVEAIYTHFGLTLGNEAAALMRRWIHDHPRARSDEHRYRAADYGLSDHQIDSAFESYRSDFGFDEA